jgi:ELWxxDGT repeat protein
MRLLLLTLTALVAALPATAQYEVSLVADIRPGNGSSYLGFLTTYDGRLFFSADDGSNIGEELWVYDAATGESSLLTDISPYNDGGPAGLTVYKDRLFFSARDSEHGRELWSYDAATGEASLTADIDVGNESSNPQSCAVYDDRLFFFADDGEHGRELWSYDAATDEVSLAADIAVGSEGSNPGSCIVYNDLLFFFANDGEFGSGEFGNELWLYDASTDEASLAADIVPGSGFFPNLKFPTVYDGHLYFVAFLFQSEAELWRYDAASGEAVLAVDLGDENLFFGQATHLTVYDDRLFFSAREGEFDFALWAYDSSTDETQLVFEDWDGTISNPQRLALYDGRLFFSANSSQYGYELWYYDAESDATTLAADINPGTGDALFFFGYDLFENHNGRFYFVADDGTHGRELWVLSPTPVANEPSAAPQPARLHTPYPNPAQDRATVSFDVDEPGPVRVEVFDVLGRRVALLADGPVAAGEHALTWEAGAAPSGLYLVRLTAGDTVQTQRLTLVQ